MALLIIIGVFSFVGAMYFGALEDDVVHTKPAGANAFSEAATGHKGFVETLRGLGVTVVVSRYKSKDKVSFGDALVVAEPRMQKGDNDTLKDLIEGTTTLLVLPKWHSTPSDSNRRWIKHAQLYKYEVVNKFLKDFVPEASLIRPGKLDRVSGKIDTASFKPKSYIPALYKPQLISKGSLEPVVTSKQGDVLLGRRSKGAGELWVLSDPDIIANHGLGQGENAVLAVSIVKHISGRGSKIVIDETVHGFRIDPNIWKLMVSRDYLGATALSATAILLVLLAASVRFGKALPSHQSLSVGKLALIENTAVLLEYGGHEHETLEQYFENARRDVAQALHAPSDLSQAELIDWLDRIAENRKLELRLALLSKQLDDKLDAKKLNRAAQLRIATMIHKWKSEMIHGYG